MVPDGNVILLRGLCTEKLLELCVLLAQGFLDRGNVIRVFGVCRVFGSVCIFRNFGGFKIRKVPVVPIGYIGILKISALLAPERLLGEVILGRFGSVKGCISALQRRFRVFPDIRWNCVRFL